MLVAQWSEQERSMHVVISSIPEVMHFVSKLVVLSHQVYSMDITGIYHKVYSMDIYLEYTWYIPIISYTWYIPGI